MAYVDESGVTTLTNEIKNYIQTYFLDLHYPVGSIYLSVNSTSPATLFGGTWERISGCFLLAATDNGSEGGNSNASIAPGYSGGEAAHTLTVNEMPAHTHNYAQYVGSVGWSGTSSRNVVKTTNTDGYTDTNNNGYVSTLSTGNDNAHNNMPPYLAVYVWKRVS